MVEMGMKHKKFVYFGFIDPECSKLFQDFGNDAADATVDENGAVCPFQEIDAGFISPEDPKVIADFTWR